MNDNVKKLREELDKIGKREGYNSEHYLRKKRELDNLTRGSGSNGKPMPHVLPYPIRPENQEKV